MSRKIPNNSNEPGAGMSWYDEAALEQAERNFAQAERLRRKHSLVEHQASVPEE